MTTFGAVVAAQTARSIKAIDLVLQEIQGMVVAAGVQSAEEFRHSMATEEVHIFLQERLKALPQADAIALVDAGGGVVNSSRLWPDRVTDLFDGNHFTWLGGKNEPGAFIIVPAVSSRSSGIRSFFLARRISGPDGQFIGFVLGAIDSHYWEDVFGAVSL